MASPPRRCVCGHTFLGHMPTCTFLPEDAAPWPCQLMVCDCRQFDEGRP